ncbi:MAG: hypothetical protein WA790_08180 [Sulfitobacter sp.]
MTRTKLLMIGAALVVTIGASATYVGTSHHRSHSAHMHGADGTCHDEVNMPGLRGKNASAAESEEIAVLFRNFETITREVENLPNGIRTVTRSSDQAVMDALVNHSVSMIDRVGQLDDPQIIIQSPTLDIFFKRGGGIISDVEMTDDGLVVVQTSDDPEVVTALQTHAAEVTAMADKGMQAVHEMMVAHGASH